MEFNLEGKEDEVNSESSNSILKEEEFFLSTSRFFDLLTKYGLSWQKCLNLIISNKNTDSIKMVFIDYSKE